MLTYTDWNNWMFYLYSVSITISSKCGHVNSALPIFNLIFESYVVEIQKHAYLPPLTYLDKVYKWQDRHDWEFDSLFLYYLPVLHMNTVGKRTGFNLLISEQRSHIIHTETIKTLRETFWHIQNKKNPPRDSYSLTFYILLFSW